MKPNVTAHNVVGDTRIEGRRERHHAFLIVQIRRHRAERHVKVLDFAGPIAVEACFDAATDSPAGIDGDAVERIGDRDGAGRVKPEQRA